MTLLVALESVDGGGKTTHAKALTAALVAQGIDARAFHHEPTRETDPWCRALHFAACRAALVACIRNGSEEADVVIVDRWWHSTEADQLHVQHNEFHELISAEFLALPRPVVTVMLSAPSDVLDARLAKRGEVKPANAAQLRANYWELAEFHGWPVVSTDRDAAEVTRELVAIVRRLLTDAVPQGVCPTTGGL